MEMEMVVHRSSGAAACEARGARVKERSQWRR
jgi:hypothetical protein